MQETAFLEAYTRLNPQQKEAVDTIEGPVMVIAGPGTGKTQILTLRIANILRKTDIAPENILALTFTESGAKAMRERLSRYVGAPAYRVAIHTFHEFAGKLMRQYPDAYMRAVGGHPMDDLEKVMLVETILATPSIKHLRPSGDPSYYVKPIMSAISEMKREYITPDGFAKIIEVQQERLDEMPKVHEKGAHKGKVRKDYLDAEKKVLKNRELLFVYRAYEAGLAERQMFDFDDMIYETVTALETNEDMLRSVQEEYQYVLADEHQDVNGSQNKILELLASYHERPNLFVVGDEKQSIYRFQGASLENFLYFEEKFPHTKTIALTENYRSLQGILDLSHALITAVPSPAMELRVPLTASATGVAQIEMCAVSHEAVEHAYLAKSIQAHIDVGASPDEIAVIVRTNQEVESLATYLRKSGIEVEASADGDILEHPLTHIVRTLIRAVSAPHDERPLFEVLQSSYVGLPVADVVRIARARSYATPLVYILGNATHMRELGVQEVEKVEKVMDVLTQARERMLLEPPHRVLEYIVRDIGLLEHVLTIDPHDGARVVRRLYDEVEEMVRRQNTATLADVEAMFVTRIAHGLGLNAPYITTGKRSVQVMTAHKSKGLEFTYVYIPHMSDRSWGGKRHRQLFEIPIATRVHADAFDENDDERKLLYVACTRAKKGLFMSMSETNAEGKTMLTSRLLEEIRETHITSVNTLAFQDAFDPLESLKGVYEKAPLDVSFVREVLKERGLSVTALNNYLRDPWSYFYRNVLRIPEVQSENAQFGTVLHDTLQHVFAYRRNNDGALPSTTDLKVFLERELGKLPISKDEYVRFHERALVALTQYLEHVQNSLPVDTKEEYPIHVVLETGLPDFPEVTLTGKLDRLDLDAHGELLRVVDYKTGKPKTRGDIEGTTKSSNGDYKRQLVFYVLLLQLHGHEQLQTSEGLLSFIEADAKGKIHEELFVVSDEEIEMLKGEIVRVVREITNGAFLNAPCDSETCEYAPLVEQLQSRFIR
jgi:DNA helicase-2/ATP-dependent DNA helicase PcrA